MLFPTLGYHAERGLTLKIHNFTIAYRRTTAQCVVREYAGRNDSVGCSTVPVPKPLSSLLKNPVVQLLHQLPFTPYTIKHVQQPRTQQLFRRDRRAPCRGIPYAKIVV